MAIYGDGKHCDGSEQEEKEKALPVVSDSEYIGNFGNICIFCRSTNIHGASEADFDGENAYRVVSCDECGEKWEEVYKLSNTQPIGG